MWKIVFDVVEFFVDNFLAQLPLYQVHGYANATVGIFANSAGFVYYFLGQFFHVDVFFGAIVLVLIMEGVRLVWSLVLLIKEATPFF